MCCSLITSNIAGSTKRTTVSALFFISYCVGNIVGPFAFIDAEAPTYESGITAVMVAYCVEIVVLIAFPIYLGRCNRLKAKALSESSYGQLNEEEKALTGFKDLTDLQNPFFRYS